MPDNDETCRLCGDVIPAARIKAIPDTEVCVRCSEEIGGEHELEVTISTPQEDRQRRRLK